MLPSESSLPIARRVTWRDTECLELVCGIANAGGGRLILDADVDSRGAVKRRTSRLMKTIPGLIAQSLNLTCAVELVLDSGRFCLEVVIPPANDPISFRGIFFFYKDGENHILDDEALDRLMQRDMEADVKWEQRPVVQASLDDLNMGLVTRFTGAARDTDLTVDLDEASAIEQTLRHAGLMTGVGTPTNAGILLLHNRPHQYIPGATVRIGFFGSHGGTPIYEDEVFGSLIEQVHSTVELLYDKYLPEDTPRPKKSFRLGISGGQGRPPKDAVHEAVLNALTHKNYDSGTPVQVSVFTDRLCIDNVGRPPGHGRSPLCFRAIPRVRTTPLWQRRSDRLASSTAGETASRPCACAAWKRERPSLSSNCAMTRPWSASPWIPIACLPRPSPTTTPFPPHLSHEPISPPFSQRHEIARASKT